MNPLTADDFSAFFQTIHGHAPFPWQDRLLRTVVTTGWQSVPVLALPTASGKTAVLDVATFALALSAGQPAAQRTAPRRIALVVDRRIVVDDAGRRANKIADAIATSTDPILQQVKEALIRLGGDPSTPLATATLRGGIYREDRWARSPAQPVLLCSTIDQVGSRLLFRGYGLSNHAWPIHAGLLGNDTLIVLDEAHCSQPFEMTLRAVAAHRGRADRPTATPFAIVTMTATPATNTVPFFLDQNDRNSPELKKRLVATKTLVVPTKAIGDKDQDFAKEAHEAITKQKLHAPGHFVLIVVNRVATARAIHAHLHSKESSQATVILLTGRTRGFDRDQLLAKHRERLMAGRERALHAASPAIIVVATQCVEVGADLDADVLISEMCPLDALRQRLGRLDRLGQRGTTTAVLIGRKSMDWDGTSDCPEDAIYGSAAARTWRWLRDASVMDGGIDALGSHLATVSVDQHARLLGAKPRAPHIFPAYVDLWAQTGPVPAVSPEPSVFLHGPQRGEPEVQIVWRRDLAEDCNTWADTVVLMPPVVGETLAVPLSAARRWLEGKAANGDLADLPTATPEEMPDKSKDNAQPKGPALRWTGPDTSVIAATAEDLRPGDVVVVPCRYGGCDAFGWNPAATATVTDIADAARDKAKRAVVWRLVAVDEDASAAQKACAAWKGEDEWPDDWPKRIAQAITPDATAATADDLRHGILIAEPHPGGLGVVVIARAGWAEDANDFSDEDDASSQRPRPLSLRQHLNDVESQARRFATQVGLPDGLINDLAIAGRFHDLGKADPRFQALLRGGNRLGKPVGEVLAKSARQLTGAAAARARERSGYPAGGRHELLSLRLLDSHAALLETAHDADLVRHLVVSHHGRCRPFAPVIADPGITVTYDELDGVALRASSATGLEHLDSGVAERFWILNNRYGRWGLAYLEACLRLADHRASEMREKP